MRGCGEQKQEPENGSTKWATTKPARNHLSQQYKLNVGGNTRIFGETEQCNFH